MGRTEERDEACAPGTAVRGAAVPSGGVRIWFAFEPINMKFAFDELAGEVAHALVQDPYSGECFVFRGKSGSRLKILPWDGLGLWVRYRRLEQATFV
jgi:transposase